MVYGIAYLRVQLKTASLSASESDLELKRSRRNEKFRFFVCVFLKENETRLNPGIFLKDPLVTYVAIGLVKIVSTFS